MFELSIKDSIAAAHFIPGHKGMCKNLHGHTWKIEVVLTSEKLNEIGMVADFIDIKAKLKDFLRVVDHVCLNDLPYFKEHLPTTENLAKYIYQNFSKLVAPLKLKRVQVWESDAASIVYYE
jgi:6-pyruvoyltetrahydropterin/6-carboxytetrahydropterin synthase